MHEVLEPVAVDWFLLPHKNAAAWILMHCWTQVAEWPRAMRGSVEAHMRRAHTSRGRA